MPHPASLRSVPAVVATFGPDRRCRADDEPAGGANQPPHGWLNPSGSFLKALDRGMDGKHDAYTATAATAMLSASTTSPR